MRIISLFGCILARSIWACFKEALGWDRAPCSLQDFFDNWLPLNSKQYHVKLFAFSVVLWSIWTTRNKMGIERKFQRSTNEVFHKMFNFLQKWKILLRKRRCKIPRRYNQRHEAVAGGVLEAI